MLEQVTCLSLTAIRTDGGTQPRAQLDQGVIEDYAQAMQEGAIFPGITVFYDGVDYWLADGFHRYHAAQHTGKEVIAADIRNGTLREAKLFSVGANASHGLRRTNADKRRAVEMLLKDDEWQKWSNREIARRCGVDHVFVGHIRSSLVTVTSEERTYITKHGTVTTMNTANIGRQESISKEQFLDEVFPGFREQQQEQPAQHDPVVEENKDATFKEKKQTLASEGFYYIPDQTRVFDAIDAGILEIDLDEDQEPPTCDELHARTQFLERWQRDNLMLGLDQWGDPLPVFTPEEQTKEKHDAHVMRVMGSSDSPEWYTPQNIINRVCDLFGTIDTDPCSNSHEMPAVPARILYTKEDDGLAQTWTGKTYLNPPYGAEISKWTDKLIAEYQAGNVEEAVALLPARIDTVWFSPLYDYLMCNVRGRIQYANSPYNAPFPCVIVYLGKQEGRFIDAFRGLGPIMRRIA